MNWPNKMDRAAIQRAVDAQAFLSLESSGANTIADWQTQQLSTLVQWLRDKSPRWRARLGETADLNSWEALPILSRFELLQMVAHDGAMPVPEHHGEIKAFHAAGVAGGTPQYFITSFAQRLIDHAFYADHQRQGRNPFAIHAWIADDIPLHEGDHLTAEASLIHGTGTQLLRKFSLFTKTQHIEWIRQHSPTYLTVRPDWIEVALVHAFARREPLPEVRQLLTFGSTVSDSLRAKARKWLGASVRHRYTCAECGPLAFQCPRSDDYHHVAVGNVKIEVINDMAMPHGPSHPGATANVGRVLVTALHQYATPLLRYDTGDRAALHETCPACGLVVPTLSKLQQNV